MVSISLGILIPSLSPSLSLVLFHRHRHYQCSDHHRTFTDSHLHCHYQSVLELLKFLPHSLDSVPCRLSLVADSPLNSSSSDDFLKLLEAELDSISSKAPSELEFGNDFEFGPDFSRGGRE